MRPSSIPPLSAILLSAGLLSAGLLSAGLLSAGLLLPGCSESETRSDAAPTKDAKTVGDLGQGADANKNADAGKNADASKGTDATLAQDLLMGEAGGPLSCSKVQDTCPVGLKCVCCGSIGPKPICICSSTCATDKDCKYAALPHCNKASSTATSGVCTTKGFNCCWMCQ